MNVFQRPAPWVAAALVSTTSLAFLFHVPAAAREDEKPALDAQAIQQANELSKAFETASERVHDSIVSINSVVRARPASGRRDNPFRNTPFEEFFRKRDLEVQEMPQEGLGSGFILDTEGHIITNNHVVRGADTLKITLADGRDFQAKVVGADPKTDVAVIKIDADNLKPVDLGDSEGLRVGQWVLAAGNPFGLSSSITAGIVSAKGRRAGLSDYEDYIQTDAAINPGNSGGPLVDLTGRVIGINTAIFTRTGGSMGIGFAIPIDLAKPIIDGLVHHGSVTRGWLGVGIQDLTQPARKEYEFQGDGVLVADVTKDGPADEAGIHAEDIIVKLNGKAVKDMAALRNSVAAITPGKNVEVELVREGEQHKVTVEIGTQPANLDALARNQQIEPEAAATGPLGLTVRDLSKQLAEELEIDDGTIGAVVTAVEPDSPAELAGLRAGDVIVKVGREPVTGARDFKKQMSAADLAEGVKLIVRSGGVQRILFIQTER